MVGNNANDVTGENRLKKLSKVSKSEVSTLVAWVSGLPKGRGES